jgi:hypothetical protein
LILARLLPWRALECLFFGSFGITCIFYFIQAHIARHVQFR